MPSVIVLTCFLSIILISCVCNEEPGEVVLTHILFRHGDRTPIDPYPKDPYRNLSYWPEGYGQLTKVGAQGQFELGKWIRKRYDKLIPTDYNRKDIYIRSTDIDRTLMSAYCHLTGLFQPNMAYNWSPDIKWQPIPVHTTPETEDMVNSRVKSVLSGKKKCPKYSKLLEIVRNSEPFVTINNENRDLYAFLEKQTGITIRGLFDVETIFSTLFIEELKGLPLPEWSKSVYPDKLKGLAAMSFTEDCFTPELARLKVGPLLKEIVSHLKKKSSDSLDPDRKAFIYSAHDTTVANVLQALRIFDVHCPSYLATILIELTKRRDHYYVSIFYRNSSSLSPQLLTLPGCDPVCDLDRFINYVTPLIPDDWERECQLSWLEDFTIEDYSLNSVKLKTYMLTTLLVLICISLLFYLFSPRRSQRPSTSSYQSLNTNYST